jgi:hypothetical protein
MTATTQTPAEALEAARKAYRDIEAERNAASEAVYDAHRAHRAAKEKLDELDEEYRTARRAYLAAQDAERKVEARVDASSLSKGDFFTSTRTGRRYQVTRADAHRVIADELSAKGEVTRYDVRFAGARDFATMQIEAR